jgi:hypothetical protein
MAIWNVYGVTVKMYYNPTTTKWVAYDRPTALYDSHDAMYDVNENPRRVRDTTDLYIL